MTIPSWLRTAGRSGLGRMIPAALLVTFGLALLAGARTPFRSSDVHKVAQPLRVSEQGGSASGARFAEIESITVGQRVAGRNPELDDCGRNEPAPDPSTWKVLSLRLTKSSGRSVDITLLRPNAWIEARGAQAGGTVELSLPELGAQGIADVLAIGPCPPIPAGDGSVVTGTFAHQPDNAVVDIRIAGLVGTIGCTDNHPFWSEDRAEFVAAGTLKPGEHVRTLAGVREVVSLTPRTGVDRVYNLEVETEHVYLVSQLGVLVHNTYDTSDFVPPGTRLPRNGEWSGKPGHSEFIPNNPERLGLTAGDRIPFRNGRPDFSAWSQGDYEAIEQLTGHHDTDLRIMLKTIAHFHEGNMEDARAWLHSNGLTPHHSGGNEFQLIPTALHGNVRHTGGAYDLRHGASILGGNQ